MRIREIYRYEGFYIDPETGRPLPKYLLILAAPQKRDLVAVLLTSRPHGRREDPPCSHDAPYAGFFLGVLGHPLTEKSWVDLRGLLDLDERDFDRAIDDKIATLVSCLPITAFAAVLDCAARSDDTTRAQARMLRDVLAVLPT